MQLNSATSAARQRVGEKNVTVTVEFLPQFRIEKQRETFTGHAATAIILFVKRANLGVHKSELPVGAVIDLKQAGIHFVPCATNPFDYRMVTDGLRLYEGSVTIVEAVEDADGEGGSEGGVK